MQGHLPEYVFLVPRTVQALFQGNEACLITEQNQK